MRSRGLILVALATFAPSGALASGEDEPLRIGRVDIVVKEVFEHGGPGALSWIYRLGNKLHIRTREEVIRRELLFALGELVDTEALEQTERNLRSLAFLRDATVKTHPAKDGKVDVRVITYDSWTLLPQVRFAKVGNRVLWSLGAAEKNLLGRGKWVELSRRSGLDRDETSVFYFDPRLSGSRAQALVSFSRQSDGRRAQVALTRPFFALSTGWAFRVGWEGFDQLDPLYEDGKRVGDLRHVRRHGDLELAHALARSGARAVRGHLAYRLREDEVGGELRSFRILQVGISVEQHRFIKMTHVNRFERAEDFNLGYEASAFVGWSTPGLGGEKGTAWFFSLRGKSGLRLGPEQFFLGELSWNARHRRGSLENSLAALRVDYIHRQKPRWLLLGTAQLLYGARLDPEVQLRLGAESGLRGYPVRQFTGTRSFRLSVEERFFIADDLAQLVSVAAAAFFDTGFAWPEGESLAFDRLKSNVGASLLLGRNRLAATTPGVRLDLAYALHPIAGVGRWQFSIGSKIGL